MSRIYSQIIFQESIVNKTRNNSHSAWHYFAGLAVIIGLLAVPVFSGLWHLWHSDKNFDGLLLVPFMCALILYRSKDEFVQCSPKQIKWFLYLLPATLGAMFVASNYDLPRIAALLLAVNFLIASFGILAYSNYRLFVGMDYPMIIIPECSGIRSLLGFVIMSSFFAVFDRHSIVTAILMVSAGAITALVLIFLKILATMQMRISGLEEYSVGSWHGLLEIVVFMIGCVALSRLSRLLKPIDLKDHKEKK
ncbi:MAG: archaeosortase/exosortase family protein [Planctomycetota bacterium]|jgi:exosortase/archaeosortase family protein